MNPIKIAFIGTRGVPANYSGFETFVEQLGTRLVKRGYEVTVYNRLLHHKKRYREYQGMKVVNVLNLPMKHLDTLISTAVSFLHALFKRYDIVYVCIVGNSPLCWIARKLGMRIVLNVDGADWERDKWKGFAKRYLHWTEKIADKAADVVIADAKVIKRRYKELYNTDSVFIPYGANVQKTQNCEVLKKWGLEPRNYILFVSRLTPENSADLLIKAYKKLNTSMKLVIVGDSPYDTDYVTSLREHSSDNIVFTGYAFGEAYRELSSHAYLFVLPAGIDGTRPVLLDQMGFGNCVLVRNSLANVEVIEDAGLTFDRGNAVFSLAAQLQEALDQPEIVEEYRHKALERVKTAYSWEAVTEQYDKLFQRLVRRFQSASSNSETDAAQIVEENRRN